MAAASNLIGLVNQLQNLEASFTAILLEAALKLSALTETNVFVLVETSELRKFGGSPHLCESYASSRLNPLGNDVQVSLAHRGSSLIEHTINQSIPVETDVGFSAFKTNHSISHSQNNPTVRSEPQTPTLIRTVTPSRKRVANKSIAALPAPSTPKSPKLDLKLECKVEQRLDHADQSPASPLSDGDSDIIFEDEHIASDFNPQPQTSYPLNGVPINQVQSNTVSWTQEFFEQNNKGDWIAEFMNSVKARSLQAFDDPAIGERESVPHKIMSSVIYELGKMSSMNCPYADRKSQECRQYFDDVLQRFWSQFPNIAKYADLRVQRHKGISTSMKVFVRSRLQESFSKPRK